VRFGRKLHAFGYIDGQFQLVTLGADVIETFRCDLGISGVVSTFAGTPAGTVIATDLGTRRLLIAFAFAPSGLTRYAVRPVNTEGRTAEHTPDTAHIPNAAGVIETDPTDFGHDTGNPALVVAGRF